MVSADNLNIDILEHIFSYLSGNDLHDVALVSKSFYDGVLPHLYRTLTYTMRHGKTFPLKSSPFAAVLRSKGLAKFVNHIDISYVPHLPESSSPKPMLNPLFLLQCRQVLEACSNLLSFTCVHNVLSSILPGLEKRTEIRDLRVYSLDLKPAQAESLIKVNSQLKSLFLDHGSWAVMNLLPRWTEAIGSTMHTLALFNCVDLNETVLERALQNLPNIIQLHVIGCPRVDHITLFRLLEHTPALEGLSFTTFESSRPLEKDPDLRHLRQVCIDTRYSIVSQPVPTLLGEILTHLKRSLSSLASFKIRISEQQVIVGSAFIDQLLASHAHSLKRLAFIGCTIKLESLTVICRSCVNLERLDVAVPNFKDPLTQARFIDALSRSNSLRTLVDTDDHTAHGAHFVLRQTEVKKIMTEVPRLSTIVSDKKRWKRKPRVLGARVDVEIEHLNTRTRTPNLWFMSND